MVLAMPVMAAAGPFSFRAEASYITDDNVGRSQNSADIRKDVFFSGAAHASYTKALGFSKAITVTGTAQVEEFEEYDGLSNTQVGGTVDFRFQTRSGFTAPIYSIFLRAMQADFETDIRDSNIYDLGFSSTRRLTDKLTGTLGVTATKRDTKEGEVFNLERTRYFGNIDWTLNRRVAVYSTYSYIDGDVFSTATPTLPILNWAEAIEPDNAFGGIANNKLVYRLDAKTQIIRLGVNIGINNKIAVDVSVDSLTSDAAGPNEYDMTSVAASVFFRF
jgi:hypothetical protein